MVWDVMASSDKTSHGDSTLGQLAQTVKAAVSSRQGPPQAAARSISAHDADSDEEDSHEAVFTTDNTLDGLEKLQNVLLVAKDQGWHIFQDRSVPTSLQPAHAFLMRDINIA